MMKTREQLQKELAVVRQAENSIQSILLRLEEQIGSSINRVEINTEKFPINLQTTIFFKGTMTQMTEDDLHDAINATWRKIISFPNGKICKHYAVTILLDELEKRGAKLNEDFLQTVIFNDDDEEILKFTDYREVTS